MRVFDPSLSTSMGWQKQFAEAYQKILLAASDTQTFLSIAYWVNFYLDGKCTLSAYHYSLAINIGLISLSSFVVSTLTVRKYYDTPLAAVIRVLSGITIIVLLTMVLDPLQIAFELWPNRHRKTSAIFFPVSCFLDPAFDVFRDNTHLQIREQIGNPSNIAPLYATFLAFSIACLGFSAIKKLLQYEFGLEGGEYIIIRRFIWWSRVLVVLTIFCTSIFAWVNILYLRSSVGRSEWIQLNPNHRNPENNFGHIGQLIPLFAMSSIVITFATEFKWPREQDSTAGEEQELPSHDNIPTRIDDDLELDSINPPRDVPLRRYSHLMLWAQLSYKEIIE